MGGWAWLLISAIVEGACSLRHVTCRVGVALGGVGGAPVTALIACPVRRRAGGWTRCCRRWRRCEPSWRSRASASPAWRSSSAAWRTDTSRGNPAPPPSDCVGAAPPPPQPGTTPPSPEPSSRPPLGLYLSPRARVRPPLRVLSPPAWCPSFHLPSPPPPPTPGSSPSPLLPYWVLPTCGSWTTLPPAAPRWPARVIREVLGIKH